MNRLHQTVLRSGFGGHALPLHIDRILLNDGVMGDQAQALALGLCDDHPVEWILVVVWEGIEGIRVMSLYGHEEKAVRFLLPGYEVRQRRASFSLPSCDLIWISHRLATLR